MGQNIPQDDVGTGPCRTWALISQSGEGRAGQRDVGVPERNSHDKAPHWSASATEHLGGRPQSRQMNGGAWWDSRQQEREKGAGEGEGPR